MKAVLQRVSWARVSVDSRVVGEIQKGIMVLLGVGRDDREQDAEMLAGKCSELRIFSDSDGKMNRSLVDIDGEALVVSQFTLYGDCRKGRRPSYIQAAPPEKGNRLYEHFVGCLRARTRKVETGIFGASMSVELCNDGPVTLLLEHPPVKTSE